MLKLNRLPNDRPVDRWPTGRTAGPTDKVAVSDIQGRVPIRIVLSAAHPTPEAGTLSIAAFDVAAGTAALRRVPRIDPDHATAGILCLVFQEAAYLRERPRMQSAVGCSSALLHSRADVSQVLYDDGRTRADRLDNALGQNVIAVSAETVDLSSKLAERSLRGLGAFRLQRASASEVASINFTPVPSTKKVRVTGHRWTTQAQIDADGNAGVSELFVWQSDDRVQPELAVSENQVGTIESHCPSEQSDRVWVGGERDHLTTMDRGQARRSPSQLVGPSVITDRNHCSIWAPCSPALHLASQRRSERLSSPHPRRNHQLSGQRWVLGSQRVVGRFVQFNAVSLPVLPPIRRYSPEAGRRYPHRFQENHSLLVGWLQTKPDRPLHVTF